jgi:hypothetical protein
MKGFDPAGEWRELAERYHQMKDEELVVLALQKPALTELAQQALTQEIAFRRLEVPPLEAPALADALPPRHLEPQPEPEGPDDPDDPYAEERALVEIRKVWSLRDALQLATVLEGASIPFVIGPEKATSVDAVTSDISKGVSVQIMSIGWYWAQQAMKSYSPFDEPPEEPVGAWKEIPVRCPKCQSTEVVIGRLVSEVAATKNGAGRFEWMCEVCGYQWEDDGIVKE